MAPEIQRPPPPYAQIAAAIREQIVSGQLGPGDRIPSVRELTVTWGVAHATAAKAVRTLAAEGLVVPRQSVAGTVVAGDAQTYSAPQFVRDVAALLQRRGLAPSGVEADRAVLAAEALLRELGIQLGHG